MNYMLMTRQSFNDLMQDRQKKGKKLSFDLHFKCLMAEIGILEVDGSVSFLKDRVGGRSCTTLQQWNKMIGATS